MEKKFWKIEDENISFTNLIIKMLAGGEWFHPFLKKEFGWEWMTLDEDDASGICVRGYILDRDCDFMPLNKFKDFIENYKEEIWNGWSKVIFDD